MMLVTGATGQLGRVVIEHLIQRGHAGRLAGLARDEAKAADLTARGVEIRLGDYTDGASLDAAMRGVERVLLISGTERDLARSVQQHANVIDAARRAGVRAIAYTGRAMRHPAATQTELMRGHFQTEDLIRASGMTAILFRNALYLESLRYFIGTGGPDPWHPATFETDIRLPAGSGKVAFATRGDLGAAIAHALHRDDPADRVYTLTAATAWSLADVAATLAELSGQPVTYTPVDRVTYEAQARARGTPEPVIQLSCGFYHDIRDGQLDETTPELADLLEHPPTTLRAGLQSLFNLADPAAS